MLEKLYISKLWRTSKILFWGIVLFCLGQAFFTYKRILNFPFFPYEMYAQRTKAPTDAKVLHYYVNGELLNYSSVLSIWQEETMLNTTRLYYRCINHNIWAENAWLQRFGEPTTVLQKTFFYRIVPSDIQIQKYPAWIADYIGNSTNQTVNSLKIIQKSFRYDHQKLVPTGEETLILDYSRES
ncbi:MAG: hypothetical protein LC105_00065 [Chitinophagales bacterium]|nr:hypothetical protein [Chitinophagales bacterium]MCZ2392240.1 hypothetical protein [Chitinophagales bacterium]